MGSHEKPPPQAVPPLVMSFAASDPTCGAGAQADALTLAALGCHPLTVITGLTVQDTRGVSHLDAVAPALVAAQAHALLADLPVAAFKIGVVASAANAAAIADVLAGQTQARLVVDPVLASGRGDPLSDAQVREALLARLVPLATVLTPNGVEARGLTGEATLDAAARALVARGARFVLLTGGHEDGPEVVNRLYDAGGLVREDAWRRLPHAFHGSGCTLASALAAFLARGLAVADAAREAQAFTWHALAEGYAAGRGQRLPRRIRA